MQQISCEDAPRPCAGDHATKSHATKSRNKKLIRVTSSNESQNHKCVDLSDYNIYLNQIWYTAQIRHCRHARITEFTYPENPRWRLPPSWISEKCQ